MRRPFVISFLQRPNAHETWVYERRVILCIEAVCLFAGILAAPNRTASLLLLLDAPRALYAAELARAVRSSAARKAEQAATMMIPLVRLTCEQDIELAAKRQQLMTAASPVVALALSVAGSSGQGLTLAAVVGFFVSLVRWAAVEGYSKWRAWYLRSKEGTS